NFYFKPPNNFEVFFKVSFQRLARFGFLLDIVNLTASLLNRSIFSIFLSSHSLSIADTKVVHFPFPPNVLLNYFTSVLTHCLLKAAI
ncbi:MAG: hypothetical protein ACRDD6_10295, partial [Tannerellaceae bacterium]